MRQVLMTLVAVLSMSVAIGAAETIPVQGAGATFPAPLYSKWVATYNAANPSVKVDYQAIGSGGGIKGITDRTVTFGATDGPMTEEQLKAAPGKIVHIPMVAGCEAMVYNLPGLNDLTLNGSVVADIYLGKITKWNDAKIAALNNGVALPDKDIVVAHRSDGSGTTWIFTNYLSKVSEDWQKNVGNANSVKWPVGLGGKGNAGVSQVVQQTEGSIGYVELAYLKTNKMQMAHLLNKDGKKVDPSREGTLEAMNYFDPAEMPEDMRISITNLPGEKAYPISGVTYLLVYQDLTYLANKDKATELAKYVKWALTEGQNMAADLDYARLPDVIQKKVIANLSKIVYEGKPVLP